MNLNLTHLGFLLKNQWMHYISFLNIMYFLLNFKTVNISILNMNTANKRQLFRIGNAWDFHETGGRLESCDMLSIKLPFFLRSLRKMLFNGRRSWIAFMMCLTCGLMSSADGCTWMVSSVAVLISRLFFQWRLSDSRGGYFYFFVIGMSLISPS